MASKFLYASPINWTYRNVLKPFSSVLSPKLKIGINGKFKVKGKKIPPFRMVTNPTNAVTKYLFWGNVEGFEYHAVRIFIELAKTSEVFFDIGANIGYYSLLASAVTEKKVRVYAFEPMPSIFDFLERNIELNGFENVSAYRLALSEKEGEAEFFSVTNPKFPSFAQLTGDGSLNAKASQHAKRVSFPVTVTTLDAFVSKQLGHAKIDLIKLDTEANEHKVLTGGGNVLSKHRPIIQCEVLKGQVEEELESVMGPYDYVFFLATDKGLEHRSGLKHNQSKFQDYYFIPKEKIDWVKTLDIKFV